MILSSYDYLNAESNVANQRLMTNTIVPALSDIIPNRGSAYSNEGDFNEPKWKEVFWGSNYDKLLRIKYKYDPKDLLYARTAVGSDAWTAMADGRLCRSTTIPAQ
jgi:hypothetical protein